MKHRYPRPIPRIWLMTDERMGAMLIPAIRALPRGSGVVFRHYSLPQSERRALFDRVRKEARRRRITLLLAAPPAIARRWHADGSHGRAPGRPSSGRLLRSCAVHNGRELRAARQAQADMIFLSPVHPTRSHPGKAPMPRFRLAQLVTEAPCPAIALGGMTARTARMLRATGFHGWAAIDALTPRR